ncbi:MAG: hypothetical protein IJW36_02165 [Clostridia bacterium]|nr:hypothetical protein [Clostridia bacterium]
MNSKKFEYTNKDIPYLKRDITFRTIFSALLIVMFIWQFVSIVIVSIKSSLTIMQICSSILVFISTLLLSYISLLYVFKDFRIIAAIKMKGRCVSAVQMLIKTNKRSFIRLYNLVLQFITLLTVLVLICSLTYSILQATFFSTISFYMPLLLTICVAGFNSIYHVKDEIHIQNTVQEYYNY